MTREELHELVDIVMDAISRGVEIGLSIRSNNKVSVRGWFKTYNSERYPTFTDFTKAVQGYIKTLEK